MTAKKYRILILDDSFVDAELIQRFLLKENLQCEFRVAKDEKSFIEALDHFSPAVILSDNSMPGFSAGEALRLTRIKNAGIPFIMVTGTVSEAFAASIIKQGADDYILKDRMSRLPAAIDTALAKRKAAKELTDYKYALEHGYIVTITDHKGIIKYANDNFCEISGYTSTELMGRDYKIINAANHPASFIENLWLTISLGKVWKGEFCSRSKDGRLYWVDATIVPFLDEKQQPYQYVLMCTNITEKKWIEAQLQRSNERFQYATEASSDIIWELDFETREYMVHEGKGKIHEFNKIVDWQLGIDGENVLLEDRARVRKSFHIAQTDSRCSLWKEEYCIYNTENDILNISNHAIFIRNKKGRTLRAIGAITDITEKRKLELKLFEQHRKEQLKIIASAVEAQEKERHAIGIELHDNVNQILLGTKLMLTVVKTGKGKNIRLINDCLTHLQSAIDENRKIAHALTVPDFDAIGLAEQLDSLADSMLAMSGIAVSIDTTGINENRLDNEHKLSIYRIAQEQCSNIVKYAAAKNVRIHLYVVDNTLKMTIADDGNGADLSKKTTGIGLNNIKGRLTILNGSMSITTATGKGFMLEVSIPVK